MANWLKILLFGGGVAIAGAGTAYLTGSLDLWLEPERPVVAALPDSETQQEPAALQVEDADEVETPAVDEEEEASDRAAADDLIIPAFDLVRVEPDGSVVIAGRAAPGAMVEVLTGSSVIANVQASPGGDFAAVLDDPLEPGDYQIVLRSTTDENVVVTSVETAIVSVPETPDGQVLALVEQPGSPSRLITVPDATDAQPVEDESAVAEAPEAESSEESEVAAAPEAQNDAAADAPEDEAAETEAAVAAEGEGGVDVAETEIGEAETDPATEGDVSGLATATEEPVTPPDEATAEADASEQDLAEASSTEEQAVVAAGSDDPTESDAAEAASEVIEEEAETATAQTDEPAQSDEETAGTAEQDVASSQQEETFEPEAQQPGAQTRVFVEAVEIDGETVFVAGQAEPGHFIRVYANDILLGETLVSEGGRFLIEARVDLPVGDYIIRADLLDGDGSVAARAAVPFEREPGETVAAVAPRSPASSEDTTQQAPEGNVSVDTAGAEEDQSESAPADVAAAPVDPEAEGEEMAADRVREDQAETDAATDELQRSAPSESVDTAAATDEAAGRSQPADETTGDEQIAAPEETGTPAGDEAMAQAEETEAPDQQMASANADQQPMSPALEPVDGAVIIRRGDNLWRISRRVYGQGVRFSTIYLANQGQIRNPDLIWPGQVFTVPAETVEGEAADLEALGEQAVDPSQVPGEIIR